MGEAIISRGFSGSSSSSNGSTNNKFRTEIITSTTLWRIPDDATGDVSVRIFGGGGSGDDYRAGSGGFMNNSLINSNELKSKEVYISIGAGAFGNNLTSGGTTSFGTYLSALGGGSAGGMGGSTGGCNNEAHDAFQFGGGGSGLGGFGGKWGGGGGSLSSKAIARGGCIYANNIYFGAYIRQDTTNITSSGLAGNGGNGNINAEDGVNTIGMGLDFEGDGKSGCYIEDLINNSLVSSSNKINSAGGGYGGCGGISTNIGTTGTVMTGGGGGYGANGGNGGRYGFGGGGGYGGKGGDGSYISGFRSGGGGGYGKYGNGGGYDMQNNCMVQAGIAAGGYSGNGAIAQKGGRRGGDGICIIQYYVK